VSLYHELLHTNIVIGAKGVIALDSRLNGHVLQLRPSMIKFSGSDSTDIELCSAAYKPLPLFLNRQVIKILEDLGVNDKFFLNLQAQAVEQLRKATLNPINTAEFLSAHNVGKVVRLPWFIKKLESYKLNFQADPFLRDVVQTAVLIELRDLKHRSRIPVRKGVTLLGIMDETGFLEEGQVFITVDTEQGKRSVIHGKPIIVTRCPALHPGDVQLVTAVKSIPENSPLWQLSNCICFSQKGSRDMPSQLSGGDLDGDLYQIIYDPQAMPINPTAPADYPRQNPQNIGRRVQREDMTDFFIEFMATDQLGRIATNHQVLADQSELGTFDNACIVLAGMHSTAVDFSKTGIPV
jgi:RNA dependent RNA polymerase